MRGPANLPVLGTLGLIFLVFATALAGCHSFGPDSLRGPHSLYIEASEDPPGPALTIPVR
jgi:hypothetical protein